MMKGMVERVRNTLFLDESLSASCLRRSEREGKRERKRYRMREREREGK